MKYKFILVLALTMCVVGCCNRRTLTTSTKKEEFATYAKGTHSIYFGFNKSNLEGDSVAKINNLIAQLKKVRNVTVVMYGYTDRIGQAPYNHNLAIRRISSIKKLLIRSGVIKANNISIDAKAVGENDPLISYDTINNHPKSRRVDIFITKQ